MQQDGKKKWLHIVLGILKNLVLAAAVFYFFMYLYMLWGFNQLRSMPLWQILIIATIFLLLAITISPSLRRLYEKHTTLCLVGLIAYYTFVAVWDIKQNQEWKERLFKEFIVNPIPFDVKIIDANFFSWMNYSGHIIFRANATTLKDIASDYQSLPKDKFVGNFFSPQVMQNADIERYFKKIPKRGKMFEGRYIFWDASKQIAYFYVGDEFD